MVSGRPVVAVLAVGLASAGGSAVCASGPSSHCGVSQGCPTRGAYQRLLRTTFPALYVKPSRRTYSNAQIEARADQCDLHRT